MEKLTASQRLCRKEACGKAAIDGWRLCAVHAAQAEIRCGHGNVMKACVECLVNAIRVDFSDKPYAVPERDLLALTARLDEHPEGWDHPCMCAVCRSYADG